MGSIVSGFNNTPNPVTGLTPKEVRLLQSTWSLVQRDPVGNGIGLFLTFFKNNPEHKNLFPFRDVPNEDLYKNKTVQAHATAVVYALSAMIDNLENTEVLINLLTKNGQSHAKRNIPPKGYWDLKLAVLEVLETELGPKINKEGLDAWAKMLDVAFSVIIENMKQPQK